MTRTLQPVELRPRRACVSRSTHVHRDKRGSCRPPTALASADDAQTLSEAVLSPLGRSSMDVRPARDLRANSPSSELLEWAGGCAGSMLDALHSESAEVVLRFRTVLLHLREKLL